MLKIAPPEKPGTVNEKLEERGGFEPPVPFRTTVFKTAAIDHSAISPNNSFQVDLV